MKTVREGWTVFRGGKMDVESVCNRPQPTEKGAWSESCVLRAYESVYDAINSGYTCRRVRVTIEELDEKGGVRDESVG